ncbi:MAG: hypothetical protein GXO22_00895 [Aquificae bacterium]|nr:hypothetical protein [Aquificota bacterium]
MYENFLEELIYEYFEFKNFFVKRNIKLRKRTRGGYDREIDILALCPRNNHLYHIESSFAADSWEQTILNFKNKKFDITQEEYANLIGLSADKIKIFKVAILLNVPKKNRKQKKEDFKIKTGAKLLSIGEFMRIVKHSIKFREPLKKAVPEKYPLLRTIQFLLFSEKL